MLGIVLVGAQPERSLRTVIVCLVVAPFSTVGWAHLSASWGTYQSEFGGPPIKYANKRNVQRATRPP